MPCLLWSRPLSPRPCWADAQSCFWSPGNVRRHLKSSPSCSHYTKVGFLAGVLCKALVLLHGLTWLFIYIYRKKIFTSCHPFASTKNLTSPKHCPSLLPSATRKITWSLSHHEEKEVVLLVVVVISTWRVANTLLQSFSLVMDCLSLRRHFLD